MSGDFYDLWNSLLPSNHTVADRENVQVAPIMSEKEEPVADLNTSDSPVAEASDTKSSNTENGKIGGLDSMVETAESDSPDDNQIEAVNELFEIVSALDVSPLREHSNDESPDSETDGGSSCQTLTDEDSERLLASSGLVEDKLTRKLLVFDTAVTIIGLLVPILAIGFGAGNIGNCPADFRVPYVVLITGILSLFMVSFALSKTARENFGFLTESEESVIFAASCIFVYLWLLRDGFFYGMNASFELSAENYCNHSFYVFNIFLDIFSLPGFIMGSCLLGIISERRISSPNPEDWTMFNDF